MSNPVFVEYRALRAGHADDLGAQFLFNQTRAERCQVAEALEYYFRAFEVHTFFYLPLRAWHTLRPRPVAIVSSERTAQLNRFPSDHT